VTKVVTSSSSLALALTHKTAQPVLTARLDLSETRVGNTVSATIISDKAVETERAQETLQRMVKRYDRSHEIKRLSWQCTSTSSGFSSRPVMSPSKKCVRSPPDKMSQSKILRSHQAVTGPIRGRVQVASDHQFGFPSFFVSLLCVPSILTQ
jgi:hypothetical protein